MSESIEQACELARHQKGQALRALIEDVLKNPKIYAFGELLCVPSVSALAQLNPQDGDNASVVKAFKTLDLFAYGTYMDYCQAADQFIPLTAVMTKKLKQLSLITMAEHNRVIDYERMQQQLDIGTVRELEDLIIDSIYSSLITAKMNQNEKRLSVQTFIGRDARLGDMGEVVDKLKSFQQMCVQQIEQISKSSAQVQDQREMMQYQQESVNESVARNKEDIRQTYLTASAQLESSGVPGIGGPKGGGRHA